MNPFKIQPASPDSQDARHLLAELSAKLAAITGNDGTASFDPNDVKALRSVFVIARNAGGEAVGCGGFRPLSAETAEIKRMYAKEKGAGTAVLQYLEAEAKRLGFTELRLETRRVNRYAVSFYLKRGYRQIPNYGKYAGRPEAVCFAKTIK